MGEQVANDLAGPLDVFVAGAVALGIVDELQPVQIAHHQAKRPHVRPGDALVQLLFLFGVGAPALHAGQRIPVGHLLDHAQLDLIGPGPLVHHPEAADEHGQREGDQERDGGHAAADSPAHAAHFSGHDPGLRPGGGLFRVDALHVLHGRAGRAEYELTQPHQRHEEHQ